MLYSTILLFKNINTLYIMKKLSIMILFIFTIVSFVSAQETEKKISKNIKTEFAIYGQCGNCEKRIEKAALIKGVKLADWNRETQVLKIIYNGRKTNPKAVKESIAGVGHDSEEVKSSDEVYDQLPGCCSYRPEENQN
ncbi:MAG: mercuric ion binding protein [Patiriisocius sp.]